MTRHTAFLVNAVSACSILMAAAPLAHAQSSTNNCLQTPQNTSDPCGAKYVPAGTSDDLWVYCSSASGTCANSADYVAWRAQLYPAAIRVFSQQVNLPFQISSGDVGWCYVYAAATNGGGNVSDFAFYPGSCNASGLSVASTQIYVGVGKTPSLPPGSPEQLGRLQNAYTGNGNYFIGIPNGPHNGIVSDNSQLIVWTSGQFDQLWVIPGGQGAIYDVYKDSNSSHVCLTAASYQEGAAIIDAPCDPNPNSTNPLSYWQLIGSNKISGNPHPNCSILLNPYTGYAIGVQGGNGHVTNSGALVQWAYDGTANQFWCVK